MLIGCSQLIGRCSMGMRTNIASWGQGVRGRGYDRRNTSVRTEADNRRAGEHTGRACMSRIGLHYRRIVGPKPNPRA